MVFLIKTVHSNRNHTTTSCLCKCLKMPWCEKYNMENVYMPGITWKPHKTIDFVALGTLLDMFWLSKLQSFLNCPSKKPLDLNALVLTLIQIDSRFRLVYSFLRYIPFCKTTKLNSFVILFINCRIKYSSGKEDFQDALLEEININSARIYEQWNVMNPWCKILRQAGGDRQCSNDSVNNVDLN